MAATNSTTTDTSAQPINIDTQADTAGHWGLQINSNIAAGPHIVVVTDQSGNQVQAIMYVVKEQAAQPPLIQSVSTAMPAGFLLIFSVLAAAIIILGIINLWLAKKVDKLRFHARKKYVRKLLLLFIVLIFVITGAGLWINRGINFLSPLFIVNQAAALERVSGQIMDPLTLQAVGGVDVAVGTTAIHTGDSGQFIFSGVNPLAGVRVTYPELNRALAFLPAGKSQDEILDIYFNPNLYNILITCADLESRGQFDQEYSLLAPELQQKISQPDFAAGLKTIFTPRNITDQELTITKAELLDNWSSRLGNNYAKAMAVTVQANELQKTYHLIFENNSWYLAE